jgi:hypothetical protein
MIHSHSHFKIICSPPYLLVDFIFHWFVRYITVYNCLTVLIRSIRWSLDTQDWNLAGNGRAHEIVDIVERNLKGTRPQGVIHLQHETYSESVDVVPDVIEMIISHGYEFVRMDECLNDSAAVLYRSQSDDASVGFECIQDVSGGQVIAGGAKCVNDSFCFNGRCVDGHCACDYDAFCPSCNVSSTYALSLCPVASAHLHRGWQYNRIFQLLFAIFVLLNLILSRQIMSCFCRV